MLYTSVPANKMELFPTEYYTNAPYVHLSLDSILELCRTYPIGIQQCQVFTCQCPNTSWLKAVTED